MTVRTPHATQQEQRVRLEPCPRRVRVRFGGEWIADSERVMYLFETGHTPVYYFPREDVRFDLLEATDHSTHCPHKGDARYWTVRAGGRAAENAVWAYPEPIEGQEALSDLVAFYWHRMDQWFEEDEEVFVHARDPYKRVDVVQASRHVRIEVDGETVAETRRPSLLFETGLPTRYYIPQVDVRLDLLEPSGRHTRCPYKGEARYWHLRAGDERHEDFVWSYPYPVPECPAIEGLMCFYNERVDLYVDGVLQERPKTRFA